ncbi:hypothetical protein SFRURICE_005334 [Spodoptera frugiperda]|nr:hypothetical protein SFRURICE_005334 [Spodoptera frugiperda]
MTVTLGLNMRLISSLSSNMFWGKISTHGQFRLYKQVTSCKNQPALDSGYRSCHVVGPPRNWPCVAIFPQNIFEDNDEIRRIFSPRVTVIQIRKRFRACIRHRGDSDEIRRIFSPRVTVIDIRKHVRACIRRRGGGGGFDPFDPRLSSIKLDVVLSLNGLG